LHYADDPTLVLSADYPTLVLYADDPTLVLYADYPTLVHQLSTRSAPRCIVLSECASPLVAGPPTEQTCKH
jgi:hypothetical protein